MADDPLLLAMARPAAAAEQLPRRLRRATDPYERSLVLQGWGIALRELGDFAAATRVLRRAVRDGDRSGDVDRGADARASLGAALAYSGRPAQALGVFDEAVAIGPSQPTRARIQMRRAAVLADVGRPAEALAGYRDFLPALRRDGDPVWLARALGNLAFAHLLVGDDRSAEQVLVETVRTMTEMGQEQEATTHLQNLAALYVQRGDLPRALATFTEAEERIAGHGAPIAFLLADRCRALLDAAMPAQARADAEAFLAGRRRLDVPSTDLARLAAEAALDEGDPAAAQAWAARARTAYERLGAPRGALAARLVELEARALGSGSVSALAPAVEALVARLAGAGYPEEAPARLLSTRLALRQGNRARAAQHVDAMRRTASRGTAVRRTQAELARALVAADGGDRTTVLRAARRGLDVLDGHRATLGATELRAHAARHGAELAALAVDTTAAGGSARDLLRWTERWRASLLDLPPAEPPDRDRAVLADLTALRLVVADLRVAGDPQEAQRLERERGRLEERIQRRALGRAGGSADGRRAELDVRHLLDRLGDRSLVSLVGSRGTVHAVVAGGGRVRRVAAGDVAAVRRATDHALFALRSLAAGGTAARHMLGVLEESARDLESLLLGPALPLVGDAPLVLVPPARLHSLPWAALPGLRDRAFSVAPAASSWLRAAGAADGVDGDVVLVGAPGLAHAGAEVAALAALHARALTLTGPDARTEPVLAALDGAALAHVAAHGTFRGDNPLLSALEMADGPLTVYDLERLRRAPYRLVLSSCESAVGSPTGADELLGLASALLGLGTAGLLASVVPVDDAATARFSVLVHERLASGESLADAVRAARGLARDPVDLATAWAFLPLGAA